MMNQQRRVALEMLTHPHVSPLVPSDGATLRRYFEMASSGAIGHYADSWAYLTQAAHMHEAGYPFGLKYEDGQTLIVIAAFRRPADSLGRVHVHLIRPLGMWRPELVLGISRFATRVSQVPVYLKKITVQQQDDLEQRGFRNATTMPWHQHAPLEDDTFPEWILDLDEMAQVFERDHKHEVPRKYRRFRRRYGSRFEPRLFTLSDAVAARAITEEFFSADYERPKGLSTPADYENMIGVEVPSELGPAFTEIGYLDGVPVSFVFLEQLAPGGVVGVYANMVLFRRAQHMSEYVLADILMRMHSQGIRYANLGGSETEGLNLFKAKFARVAAGVQEGGKWSVLHGE